MAVVLLVLAGGAGWESGALARLQGRRDIVVLRRCVDVDDLLAAAASGQADVAVVGLDADGLDRPAVDHLLHHGVRPVAVVASGPALDQGALHASRIGVRAVVADDDLAALPDVVLAGEEPPPTTVRGLEGAPAPAAGGRVVAVWGPAGAPGRTTVAVGVAAGLAARGLPTVLVDADPYGGAVAQQLGVLDEVSGLLSAARAAAEGCLPERLGGLARSLGGGLAVVTGLPRPDRWAEVRPGVLEHLLEEARGRGHVVVDTGFSLELDPFTEASGRPGRNQLTRSALEVADEVVVVGTADPVGLTRLARGLVELREVTRGAPVRVVVNRSRPTLGWDDDEVAGMVEGFTRLSGLHFLPDERAAADRALVTGRPVVECSDGPLARGLGELAAALAPAPAAPAARRVGRVRRRTAGTARPR